METLLGEIEGGCGGFMEEELRMLYVEWVQTKELPCHSLKRRRGGSSGRR